MNPPHSHESTPPPDPISRDDLVRVFIEAEKPSTAFRIGAESEKFGVHKQTGVPLSYDGEFSVCRVIESLCKSHGWTKITEQEGGPLLGATRGGASVTLEPGAQFELSGEAHSDLHQVSAESLLHLEEIAPISAEMNIAWLMTGYHPTAQREDLPWVPKQRYPIMREYLPTKGAAGLDMMLRTCTTQGNFDWHSEQDAMMKMVVALKLSPLLQAWFSNAPFKESSASGPLSHRGIVWQNMDPSRSGLIQSFWSDKLPRYEDYCEWALDSGMFLIRRGSEVIKNTGQSFRDYLEHGFSGNRATLNDWRLHLQTLFPEVRLKNTLEVRSVDALSPPLSMAALAVWTGILYDQQSLEAAYQLVAGWGYEELQGARAALCSRALHHSFAGKSGFFWAEQLLVLAESGLKRRAQLSLDGKDESCFLAPAGEIIKSRLVPAERALQSYRASQSFIASAQFDIHSRLNH